MNILAITIPVVILLTICIGYQVKAWKQEQARREELRRHIERVCQ